MICPHCKAINDDENSFCVNCGSTISRGDPPSVLTQFSHHAAYDRTPPAYTNDPSSTAQFPVTPKTSRRPGTIALILVGLLVLAVPASFGVYYFLTLKPAIAESLPEHLGLFYRNTEKTGLTELKRLETSSIAEARENLLKDASIPVVDQQPEIIHYGDISEPPATEMRLVSVESIKDDGSFKEIEFQTFLIDGKPAMKRLRPPQQLAVGRYALMRTDGYFDDGKHRFWAFEIRHAERKENGELAKDVVIALKPKPTPAPQPPSAKPVQPVSEQPTIVSTQPPGSRLGYCNRTNVVVRSSPSLSAPKINGLRRGQRVYVLNYSSNTDYWRGIQSNWVYIQTDSGRRGWVFSPFISY